MNRNYSITLRIWHWLNAIAVTGLLATFFLRKTFLSWRSNSELIVSKMAEFNVVVTTDQAKMIAKAIRAPMWEWHIIFGFALAALLIWRLLMVVKEKGFGFDGANAHMRWVYRGYKVIYGVLAFMALSGIVIYFSKELGISRETVHNIVELHEWMAWLIVAFVPLHIAGVVLADNSDQKGLTSKMISG
jgi:Ni/Fe-hydrogenase 1 B-type cytochrome subunit